MSGDPKLDASQRLPEFPFARYAELLGLEGIRIDAPDQVAPGLERAFAARGPVVVEAMTDPEIPPLPPHIELEQARQLTSALRKRDPALRDIIRNSVKGKAAELRNR
jgi:pyruvate dehydrogenase (quinone)